MTGNNLSNPVPPGVKYPPPHGVTTIPVSPVEAGNYFQPYPDPGENYVHVNTQLFNLIDGGDQPPYNLPSQRPLPQPNMKGFVADYIENYKAAEVPGQDPTYDAPPADFPWTGYKQIMQCYPTSAVPVVTTLATEFGVFDHWFCAVPSETWCNRTFWNAGTSWGFVINPPESDHLSQLRWLLDSNGPTIFNQIENSGGTSPLTWKIYTANIVSATAIIHTLALKDYWPFTFTPDFRLVPNPNNRMFLIQDFLSDCGAGNASGLLLLGAKVLYAAERHAPLDPGWLGRRQRQGRCWPRAARRVAGLAGV